jgi:ISXO2-like transposase domain
VSEAASVAKAPRAGHDQQGCRRDRGRGARAQRLRPGPPRALREVNSKSLCGFVGSVVTAVATVRTDGWSVYAPLAETFGHQSIAITRTGQPAHVALPGVHRVASLLKRWLTGTLHYGHSIDQLDYYLDEFTFRFNRHTSKSRGLLFYRLLQQAVATDPHPYHELTTAAGHNARR